MEVEERGGRGREEDGPASEDGEEASENDASYSFMYLGGSPEPKGRIAYRPLWPPKGQGRVLCLCVLIMSKRSQCFCVCLCPVSSAPSSKLSVPSLHVQYCCQMKCDHGAASGSRYIGHT